MAQLVAVIRERLEISGLAGIGDREYTPLAHGKPTACSEQEEQPTEHRNRTA